MPNDFELWLDNHFSSLLAKWLKEETGWTVKSSYTTKLDRLNDHQVFMKAREAGNTVLLTKDGDLNHLLHQFGPPPRIISVGIGNSSNQEVFDFLIPHLRKAVRLLLTTDIQRISIE